MRLRYPTARSALIVCGATCLALLGMLGFGLLSPRIRATRIGKTVIASAAGHPLNSVFDGLAPSAFNDVKRIRASSPARPLPPCVAKHGEGFLGRLVGLFEIRAKAQGGFPTQCQGHNQEPASGVSCNFPGAGCSGTVSIFDSYGTIWNSGWLFDGSSGCTGANCPYNCPSDNGYCNYIACTNNSCQHDSDCPSGSPYCDPNSLTCVQCNTDHLCPGAGLFGGCDFCENGTCFGNDFSCNGCQGCNVSSGLCQDYDEFCPEYPGACGASGDFCAGGCCVECKGPCDCGDTECLTCSGNRCVSDPFCGCGGGDGGGINEGNCPCGGGDAAPRPPGAVPTSDIGACECDSDCAGGTCDPCSCTCGEPCGDEIMVDLSGSGFMLTSVAGGLNLDIRANGAPRRVAWTAAGWSGGFLVLDRSSGGVGGAAGLLAGLVPPGAAKGEPRPPGFRALADFDLPANGGNGDGQIDARDAVYSGLRVWLDLNHNGVSDPGELLSLAQLGISSISLNYEPSSWTDAFGNRFGYRARAVRNGSPQWIYTVQLSEGR